MNIPTNEVKRDFEGEVNRAVESVLKDRMFAKYGYSMNIKMNHGSASGDEVWCLLDVVDEVVKRFKAAGYYCSYDRAFDGTPFALCVSKTPSDRDI